MIQQMGATMKNAKLKITKSCGNVSRLFSRATALCALLLLVACNPNTNTPPAPELLKEQRDVLDQAKAVDGIVQQQTEAQRKAAEKQAE